MIKNDIGILFDVSGSMRSPFNSLSSKSYQTRADELTNILERICQRGNRLKNEQIRIFSLLFGGMDEAIYDFCNLMEISNNKFKKTLISKKNPEAPWKDSKKRFRNEFKEILSERGRRPLYLDEYLFCENGPSERLCEMGCYLLEDDPQLRYEIYDSLPGNCKGMFSYGLVCIFGTTKRVNEGTTEVINDIYQKCIDKFASKIIQEDIDQRKNNGNKIKFMDGNDLIRIKNNLQDKIEAPDNNQFNILDLFSKYIYGDTPLYAALNMAFDNLKTQSDKDNNKFIFILSDGELNDVDKSIDYISKIKENARDNSITIISIFLTTKNIKEETLYDDIQNHFTKGSKDLFLMSSTLNYEHPVIKFLIQKGWNVPTSGECKLFVEVNNSQNLNKFIDLINEAIGELNTRNNKENPKNPNSLINLLSSTFINDYINSEDINKFKVNKQTGGTCYANAISASICIASARVWGRPKLNFQVVLKMIIDKYGYDGANVQKVLDNVLNDYKLHYKYLGTDENEARKAVMKTRPCVAKFHLSGQQWGNFCKFYRNNPTGILTKEILNENNYYPDEEPGGHAVVLTHICKDYLTFLNSWGNTWADKGYFKVKSADVLGASFYDVFWYISDLTNEEINSFNEHMEKLKNEINDYLFD